MPKLDIKELKSLIKNQKAEVMASKKLVAETQKAFCESPDKQTAADYRGAVGNHIKSVNALAKLTAKLDA